MARDHKKKCYVNFLGCEKRKLDTQRIIDYFKKNGYTIHPKVGGADIVVFVTCAFCKKYEDWSLSKMEKIYHQKKEGALFVVCGCLTSISPGRLDEKFPGVIQIPTRSLEKLDEVVSPAVSMREIPDPNLTIFDRQKHTYDSQRMKTPAQEEYEKAKKGYKIRIDWGCLGDCSYCVTKYAEGKLSSKSKALVMEEFRQGLSARHRSFFITGGDAGAYGLDREESIVSLLKDIFEIRETYTLHFQDFGIHWLCRYLDKLFPLFSQNRDRMGCLCMPIQSGSDAVLKKMKRPYRQEDILNTLGRLKTEIPDLMLGTHFIVGFPGESEPDFQETVRLVEEIPFEFVNVFPYSDHPLAESYRYPEKVPAETILERYNFLFERFEQEYLRHHPESELWKKPISI